MLYIQYTKEKLFQKKKKKCDFTKLAEISYLISVYSIYSISERKTFNESFENS